MCRMELTFDNPFGKEYDHLGTRYGALMAVTCKELKIDDDYLVDLSFVDEEQIKEINHLYRGIDRVTDVISFAFNDDKSDLSKINGNGVRRLLGEIFICLPRALEQAKEIGNTPSRELRFLFVHGLLHLLGYDHMTKEDEEIMFPLQEKIIKKEEEAWKAGN